ncbi:MAG: hypothetical protein JWN22_2660 [Nocardioides sp.]|nr:hypothetical protein [Nocardioides sp.]
MTANVKLAVALLVLLLAGCSSSPPPAPAPEPEPNPSFLAMVPGDARAFDGPGGKLLLIFVDVTYYVDGINANALTWELGDDVTSDLFVEDDDGTVWWYGRRGSWRAGQKGEEPREVKIVDHRARFGDRVITLSGDDGPVRLETPDGVYTSTG